MKKTLTRICGGAALAVLIAVMLYGVVLAARPIEDVQIGEMGIENIRSIRAKEAGERVRLDRGQMQEIADLLNRLELKAEPESGADEEIKNGKQFDTFGGTGVILIFHRWGGPDVRIWTMGGSFAVKDGDKEMVRYALSEQSQNEWYAWTEGWNSRNPE